MQVWRRSSQGFPGTDGSGRTVPHDRLSSVRHVGVGEGVTRTRYGRRTYRLGTKVLFGLRTRLSRVGEDRRDPVKGEESGPLEIQVEDPRPQGVFPREG